jgi:hypothetical protein
MHLFIHVASASENVLSAFRDGGWKLRGEGKGQVLAEHPLVSDEATARERLNEMGLLVSRSLGIDFERLPKGVKETH